MNTKQMQHMQACLLNRDLERDSYGNNALARVLFSPELRQSGLERIDRLAHWFELPHPTTPGRDLKGECDFVAHKLVRACWSAEALLPEKTRQAIRCFFTKWDFTSKYCSENHIMLMHEARYLYALKYPDTVFEQYGLTAAEAIVQDRDYLHEFIRFRAQRGWAEFDSLGYGPEVFTVLLNLYDFGEPQLAGYAQMSANVLLLDMIMDCSKKEGFYGGAHGRIYDDAVQDFRTAGMYSLYQLYFGDETAEPAYVEALASGFRPADYVYDVWNARPERWENRECKHLRSITENPPQHELPQVPGSINKRTLVTPDYMIGGVTWQDAYPKGSPAAWYAHHEQHEWELSILPYPDCRIFTHHPGHCGHEGNEHGYWTGDLKCCCGQFFSDRNIAMATYDIPETGEAFIIARVPFHRLRVERETHYLWMEAPNGVCAALWFSGEIADGCEENRNVEVRCYGRKHGVVCVAASAGECGGMESFKKMVLAGCPTLDTATMTLRYGDLEMSPDTRKIGGRPVEFPYKTYDSPCVQSQWNSGVIETPMAVLDFAGWGTVRYRR